jgi:pyrroloquinoline quinone biosynthesis protein B
MALSANQVDWFLINASPDLNQQMQAFPPLHPNSFQLRHNPIQGILLTNADLDHVLGLFLLREEGPQLVHTTEAVRQSLQIGLNLDSVLGTFGGLKWCVPPLDEYAPLLNRAGKPSGLQYQAIPLPGSPPPFARTKPIPGVHSVAYLIRDDQRGSTVLIAPDVAAITPTLARALNEADAVFFDGTFWSNHELRRIKSTAPSSDEIGHMPIYPAILQQVRTLVAKKRFFIHINNTNPILDPLSRERRMIEAAGWTVGEDGQEIMI